MAESHTYQSQVKMILHKQECHAIKNVYSAVVSRQRDGKVQAAAAAEEPGNKYGRRTVSSPSSDVGKPQVGIEVKVRLADFHFEETVVSDFTEECHRMSY